MSVQVEWRNRDRVLILQLTGALRAGSTLHSLLPAVEKALSAKPLSAIVISASALHAIDSAGLAEFVRLYSMASRRKLPVAIAGASRRILDTFAIARLDSFFPQYDDEASAVTALTARSNRVSA